MNEPFRVFCGWDRRQVEAAEVFKFSVEQNAGIDVEVRFLQIDRLPIERRGVTDFSYSRFLVPFLCGHEGRALFADGCDQLCLGDVAELAAWDMGGKPVWVVKHEAPRHVPRQDRARSWTSLMLMDCAKIPTWTPAFVEHAGDDWLMRLRDFADDQVGDLPGCWNAMINPGDEPQCWGDTWDGDPLKVAHWSYLSNPDGGSWIDRSGSALWAEWRDRWRRERANPSGARAGRLARDGAAAVV